MLEYDRTDISEGTDINQTNASKEYDVCHYWYFLRENFNYEPYLCNGCHDLMQKAMLLSFLLKERIIELTCGTWTKIMQWT